MDALAITPRAVIGTNSWGSNAYAKILRGSTVTDDTLKETISLALKNGFYVFDTAQDYGLGKCQKMLGEFCGSGTALEAVQISAKFTPLRHHVAGQVRRSLEKDLREFKRDYVDIYWLHLPTSIEENLAEIIELYREGKIRNIGVSNFTLEEAQKAKSILDAAGIPLFGVQNHYSLVMREWEQNGLVAWCRENGVQFWAWAVLEEGLLAGGAKPPKGLMGMVYKSRMKKLQPLFAQMKAVGEAHGLTVAQTAIVFCLSKGIVPVCGSRKPYQIEQLAKDVTVTFSQEEIAALESATDSCHVHVMGADMFRFAVKK